MKNWINQHLKWFNLAYPCSILSRGLIADLARLAIGHCLLTFNGSWCCVELLLLLSVDLLGQNLWVVFFSLSYKRLLFPMRGLLLACPKSIDLISSNVPCSFISFAFLLLHAIELSRHQLSSVVFQ